jgi:hypothetical protein
MAPPPGMAHRVATAGCVVAGKVESVEEKTVRALPYPGAKEKVEYQVAVVKIEDPILNAKGLTHVRVGFLPNNPQPSRGPPPVQFVKDQEVCLFLQPHFEANFQVAPMYYDALDKKKSPNYDKELAEVKRLAKLLSEPKEGLKAKAAADRYTTSAMLILQSRRERPGAKPSGEEPLDADVSKLVLEALAEADWKNGDATMFGMYPTSLFGMLGVTEKDGWKPPMTDTGGPKQIDFAKLPDAAKTWCKENAGTYRVKRLVFEKSDKKD